MTTEDLQTGAPLEPTNAPGRAEMPVEGRAGADAVSGANEFIAWGARSDVGLVRGQRRDAAIWAIDVAWAVTPPARSRAR